MRRMLVKRGLAALVLAVAVGATLGGCGRKGDPQRPPGKADAWPRGYPGNAPGPKPDVYDTRPSDINR